MQLCSVSRMTAAVLMVAVSVLIARSSAKKSDAEVIEDIKKYDKCILQAQFSFALTEYLPPRTMAEFNDMCKRNVEGIKCLREKTKGAEALIRRGLVTLATTRSRQSKRLCASQNSDMAQKFVAATKCILDKREKELKAIDKVYAKSIAAILQRNFNDSAPELKLLCCALHDFKQNIIATGAAACPEHRAMIEEFMGMLVTDETSMVCDDTEKLNKSCPKLERLPINKIPEKTTLNPAIMTIYLFATLGEASDMPIRLD